MPLNELVLPFAEYRMQEFQDFFICEIGKNLTMEIELSGTILIGGGHGAS